ncbi:MAG: reverse transcriptase-like protein [Deltaproteobacteria bacterium]|nr:reverse transcriptase-like protein [Deltaproteobacteria bacterium]
MEKEKTGWQRMKFRKNKVWLNTDNKGQPIVKNGKVLIKYQLEQDYEYWVNKDNVKPIDPWEYNKKISNKKILGKTSKKKALKLERQLSVEQDMICIYTDGASSGNPGPSGIGILLLYGGHEKEISKHIGVATNNIAELEAIRVALLELKRTDLPVKIFTDSSYAYGVLTLGWEAKKNTELIKSIKKIISKFRNLKFYKVKAHADINGNERADYLATSAVTKNL